MNWWSKIPQVDREGIWCPFYLGSLDRTIAASERPDQYWSWWRPRSTCTKSKMDTNERNRDQMRNRERGGAMMGSSPPLFSFPHLHALSSSLSIYLSLSLSPFFFHFTPSSSSPLVSSTFPSFQLILKQLILNITSVYQSIHFYWSRCQILSSDQHLIAAHKNYYLAQFPPINIFLGCSDLMFLIPMQLFNQLVRIQ